MISWEDFEKVDIRLGTIIKAEEFPEAKRPAYKVWVDLGTDLGVKKSSAQITTVYKLEELIGKRVLAVVNFPPRQVGKFMSEILVTGFYRKEGEVVLATVDQDAPNGSRLL
ncbi:tRNA-binding protein [Bacteriovorax sp. PP10]|uniref:tRNA-binding protein n=1 Tax=Bacteriovorax antarcticus TaxID=3088717 RepID=A0ABU5VP82_9BACT|nr:tRNA-binding protein [Bacteriovorax sp. PP10]MEA9354849.1 tRNA-binding protein [Bacteriovorax sp. PP10]